MTLYRPGDKTVIEFSIPLTNPGEQKEICMRVTTFHSLAAVAGIALSLSPSAQAQFDITQPSDPIILINGFNDGDGNSGPPPASEGVANVIDNTGNKYLNFLDAASGFQITPAFGPSVLTGLRFWTANDAPERDPASFQLEGSLNGGAFVLIANMSLALPLDRNSAGQPLSGTAFQDVSFANTALFDTYRLIFPTLRDAAAANSMQIAEVEFFAVPEPGVLSLLALAGGAAVWIRRRRQNG